MKKIFITLLLVAGVIAFNSCEGEGRIYDGEQAFAYFSRTSSSLQVDLGTTKTTNIQVAISNTAPTDRIVNVSVVEEGTTATPEMYNVGSTMVIPANSYFGNLQVEGIDDGLSVAGNTLVLKLESVLGGVTSSATHTLTLRQFVFISGDYNLEFVSGGVGAAGNAPALGTDITVTIEPGDTVDERRFNVKCYPSFGFANPPVDFSFSLANGTDVISNGIVAPGVSGVGCGGSIAFGPSPTPGVYVDGDDSTFTLVFTEDTNLICGASAVTTYTLTKI